MINLKPVIRPKDGGNNILHPPPAKPKVNIFMQRLNALQGKGDNEAEQPASEPASSAAKGDTEKVEDVSKWNINVSSKQLGQYGANMPIGANGLPYFRGPRKLNKRQKQERRAQLPKYYHNPWNWRGYYDDEYLAELAKDLPKPPVEQPPPADDDEEW